MSEQQITRSLAIFTLQRSVKYFADAYKVKTQIQVADEEMLKKYKTTKVVGVDILADGKKGVKLVVIPEN